MPCATVTIARTYVPSRIVRFSRPSRWRSARCRWSDRVFSSIGHPGPPIYDSDSHATASATLEARRGFDRTSAGAGIRSRGKVQVTRCTFIFSVYYPRVGFPLSASFIWNNSWLITPNHTHPSMTACPWRPQSMWRQ
jgi:hypothetical protein